MGWISFYVVDIVLNVIERNIWYGPRVEMWDKKRSAVCYQGI